MRILHVNDVANVPFHLVRALNDLGQEAMLQPLRLAFRQSSLLIKALAAPLRMEEFLAINRRIRSQHYDIVHIHYAYLGLMGVLGGYPYILHCHGTDVRLPIRNVFRRIARDVALRRARLVLYSTPDLERSLRAERPDAIFLPNPVDTLTFSPGDREEQGGHGVRILIISCLSAVKNVKWAFAIAGGLVRRYGRRIHFTAIDFGPDRAEYRGAPQTMFVPAVAYDQMPRLIRAHDIVLGQLGLPALGMSELESMACEKPVVCSFRPWPVYDEQPPVVSALTVADGIEGVGRLVEDEALRNRIGTTGRQWVTRHHDIRAIGRQLLDLYARVQPCRGMS
jgi:glycosyltransferase involved in cell wall biosynthesis